MSARHHLDEHAHHAGANPPAEEDRISSRTIVAVGVAALLVFFLASLAAIAALRRQEARLLPDGPAALPAELGQGKIAMLEQRLFENSNQADVMHRVQRAKLEGFGWVDREAGVVRMPIARGMERFLRGERPPGEPSTAIGREEPGASGTPRMKMGGER